ncbi:MAG: hypothetical protein M3R14_04310, partial [Acidobacteriota bacterium]|nr:hypothetical protein [Acidobacteriota bacterium]
PSFGSKSRFLTGFQVSSFVQLQSGTPFSVFSPEPELQNVSQYGDLIRGSGGIYRLGFGRPNISCTADQALLGFSKDAARNATPVLDLSCFSSPLGQNGNLGRNVFRGPSQFRTDIGIVKRTRITENVNLEVGVDVFNLFNTVNFSSPEFDLSDVNNRFRLFQTTGGPRLAQFRVKLNF